MYSLHTHNIYTRPLTTSFLIDPVLNPTDTYIYTPLSLAERAVQLPRKKIILKITIKNSHKKKHNIYFYYK